MYVFVQKILKEKSVKKQSNNASLLLTEYKKHLTLIVCYLKRNKLKYTQKVHHFHFV